jgi:SSS family solute:Na+ symporter
MTTVDTFIVFFYLVGLFVFAIFVGLRETAEDFLILSRRAPLILVLFSVVSTWVGVGTTVATAASGYDIGWSLGFTAGVGGLVGVVVAGIMAPKLKAFGDRFQAHTLGDFFAIRYSSASRLFAGGLIMIIYSLLGAGQFVGLSALLGVWSGFSFEVALALAAVSTIIYTAFAGIKSDFYTDVIHFCVMVIVLFGLLLPIVLRSTGGFSSLNALPASYFDPFAYGGVSFFAAGVIFGAGGVFVTMEIWQRIYASTTARTAQYALVISGIGIILFYLLSAFLGMVTKIVDPNLADRDHALFVLMKQFLPAGVLGLGVAAFLAVFISTVNTMLMVTSATFTKDFYKGWLKKDATERQILTVGRISTLIAGAIALVLALAIPDLITLTVNSLFILLILLPAVVGGFFWRRSTAKGALFSIIIGSAVTLLSLPFLPKVAFVPGFIASLLVFIGVSLSSQHDSSETLDLIAAKN